MESTNARKLRGLPLHLKVGIDSGDKRTVLGWAMELNTKEFKIRSALTKLNQKYGFHRYYPVDAENGHQGVIVDVTQKLEWVEQVMDRQKLMFFDPQVLSFANWADVSVTHLRKLLPKIQARLADDMAALIMIKERIKHR